MKGKSKLSEIHFTEREKNVIKYLINGLNNEEISKKLHISVHTTKAHLGAIYDKLKVHNRIQAIIKAIKCGLIKLDETE